MPTTSSCSTTSNSNCGGIPGGATTASSFSKSTNSISVRKKPFLFLSNLWRRKKVLGIDDIIFDRELNQRTRSEPSVISYSVCTQMSAVGQQSAAERDSAATTTDGHQLNRRLHQPSHHLHQSTPLSVSTLTMTPGRCRDLDQDMQALRMSRQDNPFVQKVIASRESLIDTLDETGDSDDAILMASQDFNAECDADPFTLMLQHEVQAHMIRSPPPTSWPRSPHYAFNFNAADESLAQIESSDDDGVDMTGSGSDCGRKQQAHEVLADSASGGSVATRPPHFPRVSSAQDQLCNSRAAATTGGSSLNIALARPNSSLSYTHQQSHLPAASSLSRPQCLFDSGGQLNIQHQGFK